MIPAGAVRDFQLTRVPPDFLDDPYPWYAALREHDPLHELEGGGVFVSRYEDAVAVYRSPAASSDKKAEFGPKLGDSPLYEHHTTSLVFNDPPLHTRVRRIIMGAVNQKAIARMEAQVVRLVDSLLDEMQKEGRADFIADFAARIPVEVIGNLLLPSVTAGCASVVSAACRCNWSNGRAARPRSARASSSRPCGRSRRARRSAATSRAAIAPLSNRRPAPADHRDGARP